MVTEKGSVKTVVGEKGVKSERKGSSLLLHNLLFEVFECVPEGLPPGLLCPNLRTSPTDPAVAGQPKMFRGGLKRPITQPSNEVPGHLSHFATTAALSRSHGDPRDTVNLRHGLHHPCN